MTSHNILNPKSQLTVRTYRTEFSGGRSSEPEVVALHPALRSPDAHPSPGWRLLPSKSCSPSPDSRSLSPASRKQDSLRRKTNGMLQLRIHTFEEADHFSFRYFIFCDNIWPLTDPSSCISVSFWSRNSSSWDCSLRCSESFSAKSCSTSFAFLLFCIVCKSKIPNFRNRKNISTQPSQRESQQTGLVCVIRWRLLGDGTKSTRSFKET